MNIQLPKKALKLIAFFQQHKYSCFVVGGYIRDVLLHREVKSHSMDFTTSATPEQIIKILPQARYENTFGTVIVPLKDSMQVLDLESSEYDAADFFEITTFRSEKGYTDKRHPDTVVWGTSIQEDVKRRDFTVNALAYDGKKFIDEFNGLGDLHDKIVRAVGNPHTRFDEDALRMMRAVRFACELGFTIEGETFGAIVENAEKLRFISKERVRDEFLKILTSPHPSEGVMTLKKTNLLKEFLPELLPCFEISQISPKRHHVYDVGTHLIKTLEACENSDPIVRLAALLHDIGKPATHKILPDGVVTFYNHEINGTQIAYEIGSRLKLSKKELIKLTTLVRYHQFLVSEVQTDNAIRRFIRQVGKENLQDMIDLRKADRIGSGSLPSSWRFDLFKKRIEEVQKEPFTVKDLKVGGNDVMKIKKLKPSREVGIILEQMFDLVVRGKLKNEKKELLTYLKG